MNIFEKMQKAKELILVANLKKSGVNKFAGFKYYELADILPTIIQICNELKLFTSISFSQEVALLEIINIDEPTEKLQFCSPMKETSIKGCNEIQALGGLETYQRRYLYMSAFDIIENDMFDAGEDKNISKVIEQSLRDLIANNHIENDIVTRTLLFFKHNKLSELKISEVNNFKKQIGVWNGFITRDEPKEKLIR